jgi:hypothetical protein
MLHDNPKKPAGHVPGKEFTDTGDPWGMKLGLILRVDELNMKADVKVVTGGGADRFEIDLTQAMHGPRSFWGGIPEVNSIVILGYRRKHKQLYEAMILGYIPSGQRLGYRFDPFSPVDPNTVTPDEEVDVAALLGPSYRVKRLKLRPGDVGGMSSSGAEFTLTKDVRMYNRAGDFFELRDTDRTLVASSIHRVENESGVTRVSGPIRRSAFYTYPDILSSGTQTLIQSAASGAFAPGATTAGSTKSSSAAASKSPPYYGAYVYQNAGPGFSGGQNKFADAKGNLLSVFNNTTEFPSTTYSNGRQTYFSNTLPGVNMEDPTNGAGAEAFVEYRIEVDHTSDLTQQVRDEIDGFAIAPRSPYIEHVLGTTVGNDTTASDGMRIYNRVTKPKIFEDFTSTNSAGSFTMEEVSRSPMDDLEVFTMAGAYLLAIHPPHSVRPDDVFACAVSKQGKLFLNVPGSSVERYPDGTKNVSVEANLLGALKAYVGAASPGNVSINLTCEGGIVANIGSNSDGRAIDVTYHSSVLSQYTGTPDTDDAALTEDVQGMKQTFCSGISTENVGGQKTTTVNGGYQIFADRLNINVNGGYSLNSQDYNGTIAGKTQFNYAQAVVENIVSGGMTTTVLAGNLVTLAAAGAILRTAAAGAITDTAGANYALTAGGAASFTAGGAMNLTATGALSETAGGAASITAALGATMTGGVSSSLVGPQILLGGPAAVLGICRGLPSLPVGTPTLDPITGLPLLGCAVSRSV